MNYKINIFLCVLIMPLLLSSCAPTYPREKVIEGVKDLCKKEYGVDVEVNITGTTLGVKIPLEGLFDKDTLQIAPEALEKIDGVMLSVSRVALSSDETIEFYTVITTDKEVPGAEVVLTRYVKDLRRYVYGDISRGEFSKRMIFNVRFNPERIIDSWLGEFTLRETRLEDFICEQAQRRIRDEFQENKALVGRFKVSQCNGKLEDKVFKFKVDIKREGLPMSELIYGNAWRTGVLELCLKNISHIIYWYDYKDFERIDVENEFDSKAMGIDKDQIKRWRRRRVNIE